MKKTVYALLALIMAAAFVNCEDEFSIRNTGEAKIVLEPEGAGYSLYFPYVAGKTWEYERISEVHIDFGNDGAFDTVMYDTFTWFDRILRHTKLTNINPVAVWMLDKENPPETLYVHIGDTFADFYDKIYHYDPWFSIPAEPVVGDTWRTYPSAWNETRYEVEDSNQEANGYNNCLKIKIAPLDVDSHEIYRCMDYWAPGVGKVMNDELRVNLHGDPPTMRDSLISVTRLTNEPVGIEE